MHATTTLRPIEQSPEDLAREVQRLLRGEDVGHGVHDVLSTFAVLCCVQALRNGQRIYAQGESARPFVGHRGLRGLW